MDNTGDASFFCLIQIQCFLFLLQRDNDEDTRPKMQDKTSGILQYLQCQIHLQCQMPQWVSQELKWSPVFMKFSCQLPWTIPLKISLIGVLISNLTIKSLKCVRLIHCVNQLTVMSSILLGDLQKHLSQSGSRKTVLTVDKQGKSSQLVRLEC